MHTFRDIYLRIQESPCNTLATSPRSTPRIIETSRATHADIAIRASSIQTLSLLPLRPSPLQYYTSQESHTRYSPHRKVSLHMHLLPQLPRSDRPYWEPFLGALHTLKHRTILLSKTAVCRRHRPGQYPSQLSGALQPVLKRQKVGYGENNEPPAAFWDNLSKISLTKRALRELDRRNAQAGQHHSIVLPTRR